MKFEPEVLIDERGDKVYARDYDEGFQFPVFVRNFILNRNIRYIYKVVYDGKLKDDVGRIIGKRKLWKLVDV